MNIRGLSTILTAMSIVIVILAATSTYSAWVSATNHRNNCARIDLAMDAVHDILVYATTPEKTITPEQEKRVEAFQEKSFHRLDLARC